MTVGDWIALAGFVVQLVIAAYVYGKLTGKVSEHDRRLSSGDTRFKELGAEQDRIWKSIGDHGERISAIEADVRGLQRGRSH